MLRPAQAIAVARCHGFSALPAHSLPAFRSAATGVYYLRSWIDDGWIIPTHFADVRSGMRFSTAACLIFCSLSATFRAHRKQRPFFPALREGDRGLPVDNGAGQPLSCGGKMLPDQPLQHWEIQMHSLVVVMISMEYVTSTDLRHETSQLQDYADWGYYGQWSIALANVLMKNGLLCVPDLLPALGRGLDKTDETEGFEVGEQVCIKRNQIGKPPSCWRRPHLPVPGNLHGACGEVIEVLGKKSDPVFFRFCSELGLVDLDVEESCYSVEFCIADVVSRHLDLEKSKEKIRVEVFEGWLSRFGAGAAEAAESKSSKLGSSKGSKTPKRRSLKQNLKTLSQEMHDLHSQVVSQRLSQVQDASHTHEHLHLPRSEVEQAAIDKEGIETPGQRLTEALIEILTSHSAVQHRLLETFWFIRGSIFPCPMLASERESVFA